jgi:hypothetical protein
MSLSRFMCTGALGQQLVTSSSQTDSSNVKEDHSDVNPVFEEGADPFLLLAKEVGFGPEGGLEEETYTEWALFMSLIRSHYEQYLPIKTTEDDDRVTFGDELASGIDGVTGSFRRKNGIFSIFFKYRTVHC